LEATIEEILLMPGGSDLKVICAGEEATSAPAPAAASPTPAPAPARGGGVRGGGGGGGGGGGTWYQAAANLRVRSGPEKDADIVADIPKTDKFEVLMEQGDWFKINTEGTVGWVLSRNKARTLVEKTTAPPGATSSAAAAAAVQEEPPPPSPKPAAAAKKAEPPKPAPKAAAAVAGGGGGGNFYKIASNMNVRDAPDGSAFAVTGIAKGDVIKVRVFLV
jgi:uncharacterized protein YgiM (DUF1202 family)